MAAASPTPTYTPTYDTGGKTKPLDTVTVAPERARRDEDFATFADGHLNPPFIADFLSAALTHERCGYHLYRSVGTRTNNPVLERRYREFGSETEEHINLLEQLISKLGGDPQYVSPSARLTEKLDGATMEATYLLEGSADIMTRELAMLDAVVLAETVDHANWEFIGQLADELPEGSTRDAVRGTAAQVCPQEDRHLMWAQQTRKRLLAMQATRPVVSNMAATAEEAVQWVRDLLSDTNTGDG